MNIGFRNVIKINAKLSLEYIMKTNEAPKMILNALVRYQIKDIIEDETLLMNVNILDKAVEIMTKQN